MVGIVGEDGAAFTGGELLVGIETEDGQVAEAAGKAALKLGADGFTCVFNEREVVAAGDGLERVHVGGDAEGVHNEDGAGA